MQEKTAALKLGAESSKRRKSLSYNKFGLYARMGYGACLEGART
jgi:hypothetical protein